MANSEIITRIILDKRVECVPCFYLAKIMTVLGEILEEEEDNNDNDADESLHDAELYRSER